MKNRWLVVVGVAALVVGIVGAVVLASLPTGAPPGRVFSSAGQRIYYLGVDATGRPIPRTIAGGGMMGGYGMMGAAACVDCHGEDGRGGRVSMMYGQLKVSDIRYSTLTMARSEDGTAVPAWTDSDIARAIREGVEPDGEVLTAPMPRWDMTDAEVTDVIAYLKELSAR